MSESFAPPGGPPPSTTTRTGVDADGVPDEAPPAYTPSATQQGHTTLQAGPNRMDFSGPPPMPARLEQNITGVGVGFEPRTTNGGHNAFSGMTSQQTGSGFGSSNPFVDQNAPAVPPRQPSTKRELSSSSSYKSPSGPLPSSSGAGPSRPPPPSRPDLTPTEAPTPGRPLLRNGQMLVYPKNHYCSKCGNTGYKANDPSNPCSSDWRKYGKQYTSALAHSYTISTAPDASTQSASNFQRPLPNHQPAAHSNHSVRPPPPPPGNWNTFPGHGGGSHHFNGPHPGGGYQGGPPGGYPNGPGGGWNQPQMGYGSSHAFVGGLGGVPPNALVVQPGDPRIGGIICRRCGGSGRELDWFGFDDGKCWACRGLGRVF